MPNGGHYPMYECNNCERVYDPDEDLGEKITEKNWHFEPGSVVPYGVCDCGGYIYKIESSKDVTNCQAQSEFAARAFDGLMRLFSEEQRAEFAATGCITIQVHAGVKKMPFMKVPYGRLERRVIEEMIKKDGSPYSALKEFVPNFSVTREQLEAAAKERPSLVELLEKQVSEKALEAFGRVVHHEVNVQRRAWKETTFGERYGIPLSSLVKKEKP